MAAPLIFSLLAVAAGAGAAAAANNTVFFIEQDFFAANASALARVRAVCAERGGTHFRALSLKAWPAAFSPANASSADLPPPDAATVAFLRAARAAAPAPLAVYGGIDVCGAPAYACMLDYALSNLTGQLLARAALAAGLDGVQIYASPYCNNADCKRTTGRYAVGLAAIVAAFQRAAPGLGIVMLANEWDNIQIIAAARPTAVFSYQTVFYFTSVADCQAAAGALCGAGENVFYVQKAGKNFTAILRDLAGKKVGFLGQLRGASAAEAENPADFWPALYSYATGQ